MKILNEFATKESGGQAGGEYIVGRTIILGFRFTRKHLLAAMKAAYEQSLSNPCKYC